MQQITDKAGAFGPSRSAERLIAVTPRSTLDGVLNQLRDAAPGPVVIALDPLSVLFSTPDHFRALDGVRVARSLALTLVVDDPHRTGLALAFGYRVRARTEYQRPRDIGQETATLVTSNGTQGLEAASAHPVDSGDPHDSIPSRRVSVSPWYVGAGIALIVVMCVVAGALLVRRVHTAEVIITPSEQSFSRVVPFAVSIVPTNDPNAIQTTAFETTITREGDAPATGKATLPDGTATGMMTFRSRADGATTIKAGTALKGPRDISYVLLADVVVPGLDFGRGQLGEATARVRATQPGPGGNLPAGFSVRYTENVTYISGDITGGTEKQVTIVTDDDIAAVRSRLESDLRVRALTEVNAALPAGVTALNDYLVLRTPSTTAQPVAGAQADSVHVRVALTAQVPVYRNADFDALIDRRLNEAVHEAGGGGESGRQVLTATVIKAKPTFIDVQGQLVRYFATVTGKTRSVITDADVRQLRANLAGKGNDDAARVLANNVTIQHAHLVYGPSWLPRRLRARMPRDLSHIAIRVEAPGV